MTEIQKAMKWLISGNTGLSSECIFATMLNGGKVEGADEYRATAHPRDPSDFKRCVTLLNDVPTFRTTMSIMMHVSKEWSILVEHWDELEQLLNEEIKTGYSAPKLYTRMKELFNQVGNQNDK